MIFLDKSYWQVKATRNKGRGMFAKKTIAEGVIIGDYIGKVLRTKDVDLKSEKENLYLMYYHDQASIYPDLEKPGIHLINHSCNPNCWVFTYRGHTLVFALKNIKPEEELTISYLLPPKSKYCDPCPHDCCCGFDLCTKTLHSSEEKFEKWRNFQNVRGKKDKRARVKYGSELKLLSSYPKKIPAIYIKTILLDLM